MADRASWVIKNGDYLVQEGVGFVTAKGVDAALQDRLRELLTPAGSYGIPVFDVNGFQEMDFEYGNILYNLLNTPIHTMPIELIINKTKEIFGKDPTLSVESVNIDFSVVNQGIFRLLTRVGYPDGTIRDMAIDVDGTLLRLV